MKKTVVGVLLLCLLSLSACTSTRYLAPTETGELLRRRAVHVILEDATELKLSRCVVQAQRLTGFSAKGERIEVEMSRIRAVYIRKIRPGVPLAGAFSAGAVGMMIWLLVGAATAPDPPP